MVGEEWFSEPLGAILPPFGGTVVKSGLDCSSLFSSLGVFSGVSGSGFEHVHSTLIVDLRPLKLLLETWCCSLFSMVGVA